MRIEKLISPKFTALVILCVIMMWAAAAEMVIAHPVSLSGYFHVIWQNAPPDPTIGPVVEGGVRYVLIGDQGQWIELLLDETLIEPLGGPLSLNYQRVKIEGERIDMTPRGASVPVQRAQRVQVQLMEFEQPAAAEAVALDELLPAVRGAQPWVNLLCRFADAPQVTPHPVSWFQTLMGTAHPGLDHYWQELSYGQIDLTGTAVAGWYDLPQPRSYYIYDWNGDGIEDLDFGRAVDDCTAVANADVFFPDFVGINLMFNQSLDCCAWGGGWTMTRDGQTVSYRVTWLPPWGYENQGVLAHEMGHGFGLPHSSGPYSATYDSRWDVMSNIWENCSPPDPDYGCIGVHTISHHKAFLGWNPSSRQYTAMPGTSQSLILEPLSLPASGSNYQMARLPIAGSLTNFYTVEARMFIGYDEQIPGEAIVIHRVDTTRGDRVAQVVDSDNDGDPNDAGAMWLPGETFTDPANGITVSVDAATPTGFAVTITSRQQSLPDLVETAVTNPPATRKRGGKFSVTDTAKNIGTAKARASVTRYYLSLDARKGSGDELPDRQALRPQPGTGGEVHWHSHRDDPDHDLHRLLLLTGLRR